MPITTVCPPPTLKDQEAVQQPQTSWDGRGRPIPELPHLFLDLLPGLEPISLRR